MHLTIPNDTQADFERWQSTPEEVLQVWNWLETTRERLRVTRERAADRQRLAENARAAGQEAFEVKFRDAADAYAQTAHALEDTVVHLERCWARMEEEWRHRERLAMRLHAARGIVTFKREWPEAA